MKKIITYSPLIFVMLLLFMLTVSIAQAKDKGTAKEATAEVVIAQPQGFAFVSAHPTEQSVLVRWGTFERTEGSTYSIEWAGAAMNWQQITTLDMTAGRGTILAGRWMDEQPQEGINYYRVCQVAADGTILYSKVVTFIKPSGESLAKAH